MPHDVLSPAAPADFGVRLARGAAEITAAQRLRYQVFYEEMGAQPCPKTLASGIDHDHFDGVCDHLLAFAGGEVVGTYRLIRRQAAERAGGFYSAAEFDIDPLLNHPGEVLELGRSCVDARWRNRGAVQLLWQGIAAYIIRHRVRLLFGCASLPGTDVGALAAQFAYLHDNHLAPENLRTKPRADRAVDLGDLSAAYDPRQTLRSLPPLLKGYLRTGGMVGEGAVIDHEFNTTDVLVVLDADAIAGRYQRHYVRPDDVERIN
jgi:putative hemolysin